MRTSPPFTLAVAAPVGKPRFASVQEALIAAAPFIVAMIKAEEAKELASLPAPGADAGRRTLEGVAS